jgi:hypothetical protein
MPEAQQNAAENPWAGTNQLFALWYAGRCVAMAKRPVVPIVEDEFLLRKYAAGTIEDTGFEVVKAGMLTKQLRSPKQGRTFVSSLPISKCPVPWMG